MNNQIKRIEKMEQIFDKSTETVEKLDLAIDEYLKVKEYINMLESYYENGDWLADYRADEAGDIPEDLKRGVLSQDALYDLLVRRDEMLEKLKKLI